MPSCAAAEYLTSDGVQSGRTVYIREDNPESLQRCEFVLQNGPEFVDVAQAQHELQIVGFCLGLVIIFVLGWIAGAQR